MSRTNFRGRAKEPPPAESAYELRPCDQCGEKFGAEIGGGRWTCGKTGCLARKLRQKALAARVNARPADWRAYSGRMWDTY